MADRSSSEAAPADLVAMSPLWVPRADFLGLLSCHPDPARAGEFLWAASEPWVSAVRDLAAGPEVLLAELGNWASLVDQHSTLRVAHGADRTWARWENLPGIEADELECSFRLGALSSLLGVEPGVATHPECRSQGDAACRFAVAGLAPAPDEAHERLLREAMLLVSTLQGREAVFRRLSSLSAASEPFPDIHDMRAVRRFMEELEDAVVVFGPNLWVLDANHAAVELFEMSLVELRGLSARDLFSPASYQSLELALPELRAQGSVRDLLLEGMARSRTVPLEVSGRASGTGNTFVFIARDIGEHHRLERELERRNLQLKEQNERIAEADRIKSEFLANVSHELTTPLTCIKGFARLLHGDVREEAGGGASRLTSEKRLEFLAIMQREAERVLELIRGLLELSTIEAGGVALDRARVSLNTVVRECLLLLKPRFDERSLRVDCRLDQAMPLVLLDPNRIKQVILNLVDNAVKFAPSGSAVRIRTHAAGEVVRLVVKNEASDLEEADLARIFERFVQRDGTFARQHGGVGLGLNLVRAIVELHGGRVWAEFRADSEVQLWAELPVRPS
jgi:PAS domain S-box-containing protein